MILITPSKNRTKFANFQQNYMEMGEIVILRANHGNSK